MEPILTATAYIHTRLGRTAYMASGSIGPPLLFVHGNSCCKEAFAKQFDNSALRRHRLLAVDLPGHGNSDDMSDCPANATLANFALWLREVIQNLGLGKPVVVGWSLGGHIAIEGLGQGMALAGLVLCGTPPAGPGAGEMEEAFMPSPEMAMTGKAAFTEAEAIRYCDSLYGGADLQNTGLAKAVRRAQGAVRESLLENYQQPGACHSQRAVVADNACPIAVIQGGADAFVNRAYFETLQWRNLWRDRVQFIETAGHAPFFERPDAFNATLLEFLGDLGYRA
ncbi:MAG: alpha/beta hydrolase [Gammaproteobacteria bacterium]|nr:alpha/beta hydrolase [Gammaproteobacteria bacterium]